MAHLERLLGPELVTPDGSNVSVSTLQECELISLYFSAQWCPPCKGFLPNLRHCYDKVKERGKRWEVVFVSLDTDKECCQQNFAEMPWLMVPYESALREPMPDKYGLMGIPALVFINPKTGETLTEEGRTIILSDKDGDNFPWNQTPT
ncbi:nucleoredoxin [Biomphalaria pfeifferi]|uniref:Nucleoredoxin n=1 Tax=Biomphalaria pfeifferi TaxID=112525 RepID=A0AAD8AV74_BIOPF|nr:nucleoredoxin [Biomphalaria pfeifferi]